MADRTESEPMGQVIQVDGARIKSRNSPGGPCMSAPGVPPDFLILRVGLSVFAMRI
jgi:hypothetical protein